jgi:hypothetical protein
MVLTQQYSLVVRHAAERLAALKNRNEDSLRKDLEDDTISSLEEISSQTKKKIMNKSKLESPPNIIVDDDPVIFYKMCVNNVRWQFQLTFIHYFLFGLRTDFF